MPCDKLNLTFVLLLNSLRKKRQNAWQASHFFLFLNSFDHSIKHDHSCKILYVCFLLYQTVISYSDSMKLRSAAMLKTMRNALLREQVDQKRNLPVVKKKLGQVSQQSKKKKVASRKAAKNARRYVKPVLSSNSR